jgi:hypothetical protein
MMEGLGRLFNVVPIAAGTLISLKDAAGITFVCSATTDPETFTLNSAATYNGSTSTLTSITRYYTNTSQSGGAQWTDSGDISAVDNVVVAAGDTVAFYVDASDLPAGAEYVEVAVTGSGTGVALAITGDLLTQRTPANLRALSGSTS